MSSSRAPTTRSVFLSMVILATQARAYAETVRFKPKAGFQTYAVREPVLRVRPGDVVETETLMGDFYTEAGGAWPGEVGPIWVEGATPADTLVVKIVKLRPNRELAVSPIFPDFGALHADRSTPMLNDGIPEQRYLWRLDRERLTGTLSLRKSKLQHVTVPLSPMLGRVAVAPAGDEHPPGLAPGNYGGNMDTSDAREGNTVYLPVFHEGAYFYFGDGHALQGDGEICGTGLEATMDVTFEFGLIKGKAIRWPRFEDKDYLMVAGSVRPLMDAFRIAYVELIQWLVSDYGFDRWEAYQLVSQVGVTRVANAVDTNYTVMAKFPKKYLPSQ